MASLNSPESPQETATPISRYRPNLAGRYQIDRLFQTLAWLSIAIGLGVLLTLLLDVAVDGLARLDWQFLTSYPSRRPARAGALSAIVGSIWMMGIVATVAFPIGVATGVFLEEFAKHSLFASIIEINITNLAGVPSIIYGLLGLQVFVRMMEPITGGRTILAGGLTLSLLVLPIVIVATREALRAVPDGIRQAGYAIGATQWQTVRDHVMPIALPGILTGTILALSRAIGETASLITIGALTFIAFLPPVSLEGLQTGFTVLPIQIFNWVSRPQVEFHNNAAAAIIVLMAVLITMNGIAIYLRNRFQTKGGR